MGNPESTPSRRGRPPSGSQPQREAEILDAAMAALLDVGYERATTEAIARRAKASKQTLYTWFGDREGIFRALIERNAESVLPTLKLDPNGDPAATLTDFARRLLTLLTGPESVALNRAAMASPELAATLRQAGRDRIGPLVAGWLDAQHRAGRLRIDDSEAAFRRLYGLVIADRQIAALLGQPQPSRRVLNEEADTAVAAFMWLHGPHSR